MQANSVYTKEGLLEKDGFKAFDEKNKACIDASVPIYFRKAKFHKATEQSMNAYLEELRKFKAKCGLGAVEKLFSHFDLPRPKDPKHPDVLHADFKPPTKETLPGLKAGTRAHTKAMKARAR